MLTVILLLSGPHRLAMMETAFNSIPIDSPIISEVVVRHQGGPWNWGGAIRDRILAHPKVRLLEFPDKVDWRESFNRTLDAVNTQWGLMLPDDDFLVRQAAKESFEYIGRRPDVADYGMIVFGWYYLKDGRYTPNRFRKPDLASILTCTPKFCTTWLNLKRVREIGGFGDMGGFVDAELYGRLACNFNAAIVPAKVGVYRLHEGQESNRIQAVYAPFVAALSHSLARFARNDSERTDFESALSNFIAPRAHPRVAQLRELVFQLRSLRSPRPKQPASRLWKWSEA